MAEIWKNQFKHLNQATTQGGQD